MAKEIGRYPIAAVNMDFDVADGGMPEGQLRSSVNNAARERMRALRNFYNDQLEYLDIMSNPTTGELLPISQLSPNSIRVASGVTDMSGFFNVGRRIKTQFNGVDVDLALEVQSVSYSNPNTDVVVTTAGVSSAINNVLIHSSSDLRALAFQASVPGDFAVPQSETAAGIEAAYQTLSPRGGIVLLRPLVYNLETRLVFDDHPVVLMGQGAGATVLLMDAPTNLENAIEITGAATSGTVLRDFTLDGNRGTQVSGTGHGILIEGNSDGTWIDGLEIKSTRGSGIYISGAGGSGIEPTRISGCWITDVGHHCIGSDDSNNVNASTFVSDCYLDLPGQETTINTNSSCIYATGKRWSMKGIVCTNLNLGGSFTQTGITFAERLAIDPDPADGRFSTLVGFSVDGTGINAVGVGLHGEHNSVSSGAINLTGATARGIVFNGSGGSRSPVYNTLRGITIKGANIGILLAEAADKNSISDCIVFGCDLGVVIQGSDQCRLSSIFVDGNGVSGTTGFVIAANSTGNRLSGCSAINIVGTAIELTGGDDSRITDFLMDTVDSGIEIFSGTTGTDIDGVRSIDMDPAGYVIDSLAGAVGTKIKNTTWDRAGAGMLREADRETILWHSVEDVVFQAWGLSNVGIDTGNDLATYLSVTPVPPPNGVRKYNIYATIHILNSGIAFPPNGRILSLQLKEHTSNSPFGGTTLITQGSGDPEDIGSWVVPRVIENGEDFINIVADINPFIQGTAHSTLLIKHVEGT